MYGFDYGNGPYRREDIVKALCKELSGEVIHFKTTGGISTSDYLEKLLAMTEEEISAEAIGKDSSLTMREFLNNGDRLQKLNTESTIFAKSVINDYAYLCYQDGGTQPDETSLEQYKKNVEEMSIDELVSETSVIETSEFKVDELIDYIELWLKYSKYAAYDYEKTSEGGSILKEVRRLKMTIQEFEYKEGILRRKGHVVLDRSRASGHILINNATIEKYDLTKCPSLMD